MGVVNRCALGVRAREPLRAWAQTIDPVLEMDWGDDPSLYLIPEYDNDEQGAELLRQGFDEIFQAELDSWCTDPQTWPQERTYELFLEWFEVIFYPVVEDLVDDEELTNEPSDEELALYEEVRLRLERESESGKGFG
jgi:hypothetical protein